MVLDDLDDGTVEMNPVEDGKCSAVGELWLDLDRAEYCNEEKAGTYHGLPFCFKHLRFDPSTRSH
jgi:hypothetical protein